MGSRFSGSPADSASVSARSYDERSVWVNIRYCVGTAHSRVTPSSSITERNVSGSNSPSYRSCDAPVVRPTPTGDQNHFAQPVPVVAHSSSSSRSTGSEPSSPGAVVPSAVMPHQYGPFTSSNARIQRWRWSTGFGWPVVPEV